MIANAQKQQWPCRGGMFYLLLWFKSRFQAYPDIFLPPYPLFFTQPSVSQSVKLFQHLQDVLEDDTLGGPGPLSGRSPRSGTPSILTLDSLKHWFTKNYPRGIVGWQVLCPNIQNPKFQTHKELPVVTHSLEHY